MNTYVTINEKLKLKTKQIQKPVCYPSQFQFGFFFQFWKRTFSSFPRYETAWEKPCRSSQSIQKTAKSNEKVGSTDRRQVVTQHCPCTVIPTVRRRREEGEKNTIHQQVLLAQCTSTVGLTDWGSSVFGREKKGALGRKLLLNQSAALKLTAPLANAPVRRDTTLLRHLASIQKENSACVYACDCECVQRRRAMAQCQRATPEHRGSHRVPAKPDVRTS